MVDFLDAGEIALFFAHFELRERDEGFKRISPWVITHRSFTESLSYQKHSYHPFITNRYLLTNQILWVNQMLHDGYKTYMCEPCFDKIHGCKFVHIWVQTFFFVFAQKFLLVKTENIIFFLFFVNHVAPFLRLICFISLESLVGVLGTVYVDIVLG